MIGRPAFDNQDPVALGQKFYRNQPLKWTIATIHRSYPEIEIQNTGFKKQLMTDNIHLTVGIVCEKDGKLLMVEEKDKLNGKQVINQPAGHVEAGETFKQAALREALEETGYRLKLESLLGLSCHLALNGVTYYRVSFLASCPDQTPEVKIDDDIDAVHWMTPEEILAAGNHRSKLVAMDIHRFLDGQRYPLEMISE